MVDGDLCGKKLNVDGEEMSKQMSFNILCLFKVKASGSGTLIIIVWTVPPTLLPGRNGPKNLTIPVTQGAVLLTNTG